MPEMIPLALDMACKMFAELCGGEVSVGTIDVRTDPRPRTVLKLRPERVAAVLGANVPRSETSGILTRLGCAVSTAGPDLAVEVPSYRADLAREIDLIEEVARVYGLDRIPATLPPRRIGRGGLNRSQTARRNVEDLLVGAGLTQVINYSFGDDKWPGLLRLAARGRAAPYGDGRQPSQPGPGLHAHHAAARASRDGAQERIGARRARAYL